MSADQRWNRGRVSSSFSDPAPYFVPDQLTWLLLQVMLYSFLCLVRANSYWQPEWNSPLNWTSLECVFKDNYLKEQNYNLFLPNPKWDVIFFVNCHYLAIMKIIEIFFLSLKHHKPMPGGKGFFVEKCKFFINGTFPISFPPPHWFALFLKKLL